LPGNEHPIITALRERHSTGKLKPDPVPRELVEQIITAATWAPNHRLTEPWRFVVLVGAARAALGEVMAGSLKARLGHAAGDREAVHVEKERNKPLRAPVVIAVAALPSREPNVVESEEVAAVAAAVQNMLLAAEALGLGAIWRTGEAASDPRVREHLGFPAEAHLVAFVYLGYPEFIQRRSRDGDGAAFTTWRG